MKPRPAPPLFLKLYVKPPAAAPRWPLVDAITKQNLAAAAQGGRVYRVPSSAPRTLPENAIRMHQPGSGHGVRR